MSAQNGFAALLAAVTWFLLVGVAVTELAAPRIEFSVLVGLPAGVLAGLVAGGVTHRWLERGAGRRRRVGVALAAGSAAFVCGLLVLVAAGVRNSLALPAATAFGGVVAVAVGGWWYAGHGAESGAGR